MEVERCVYILRKLAARSIVERAALVGARDVSLRCSLNVVKCVTLPCSIVTCSPSSRAVVRVTDL